MARLDVDEGRAAIVAATQDPTQFLGATFSGRLRGGPRPSWARVTLRPILLRDGPHVQCTRSDGRSEEHENVAPADVAALVTRLLQEPFAQVHLRSTQGDLHLKRGRKGQVHVSRGKPHAIPAETASAGHDAEKDYLLPPDPTDPLLRALGLLAPDGGLRPSRRAKFRQVNEFLRILDQVTPADGALHLVDCGCGSAWLTFAGYHYLRSLRERQVTMTGVDLRGELIAENRTRAAGLGWEDVHFEAGAIADHVPAVRPNIVLCLHACDTATDEAIAQGIRWEADALLIAPCCQHDLQEQLVAEALRPILRYGILRERLGDILTDTFRALVLQVMGYRTAVVEFVSSAHTARNIMIRAERTGAARTARAVEEYRALQALCGVTPALETMLGTTFTDRLAAEPAP